MSNEMMSADEAGMHGISTSKKVQTTTASCVICRETGKTQRRVILKPGHEYVTCLPLKLCAEQPETGHCHVEPITTRDDEIFAVNMCYQNLTEATAEDEPCIQDVLRCATFDTGCMCWPESFTHEDLDRIKCRQDKPCFSTRAECVGLPGWLQDDEAKGIK